MRLLRRLGCHVTPASGMLEAVKLLGKREFDLALVDLQLPGDYSFAMAAGMPVMAIVGSGAPIDTKRLRELGFDDHVCKPFLQREMLARLSKYLPARAPLGPQESSGAEGTPAPAPTAQSATPALDPAALARLMELDPKGENHLLERVLKAFQVSVARLRPQAVAARASKDLAGLRLVAHTLKSSSASIGAMHLSQVCAQIEATIRGGDVDDIEAQIDTLDAALDNALLAIDEQLKGCA
jgi:HPt (histidine-containing phosphotransfer) domain-containing protein/CheY-like chemotaxis protein